MRDKYGDTICYCGDPAVYDGHCKRHRPDPLRRAVSDAEAAEIHAAITDAHLDARTPG